MNNLLIEAGVTRVEDAVAAERAGARRLELNTALVLGGLTPSWGLLGEVIRAVKIPVMVMIRPRAGGFCYSPKEVDVMRRDVVAAVTAGARGVVFGPLTPSGQIDAPAAARLVQAAGSAECIFHRAFDFCAEPHLALEQLIALGFRRVMTSGGAPTALEGAERIASFIEAAGGRIEILPAGGIRAGSVAALQQATGCTQIHASFRKTLQDATPWPTDAPALGAPINNEHDFDALDAEEIMKISSLGEA